MKLFLALSLVSFSVFATEKISITNETILCRPLGYNLYDEVIFSMDAQSNVTGTYTESYSSGPQSLTDFDGPITARLDGKKQIKINLYLSGRDDQDTTFTINPKTGKATARTKYLDGCNSDQGWQNVGAEYYQCVKL